MALLMPRTFTSAFKAERATRNPTRPRTPILTRVGRTLARTLPSWSTVRTAALSVSGFGCLTAAAWTWHTAAGLAAAGLSLLVIEYLTGTDQ